MQEPGGRLEQPIARLDWIVAACGPGCSGSQLAGAQVGKELRQFRESGESRRASRRAAPRGTEGTAPTARQRRRIVREAPVRRVRWSMQPPRGRARSCRFRPRRPATGRRLGQRWQPRTRAGVGGARARGRRTTSGRPANHGLRSVAVHAALSPRQKWCEPVYASRATAPVGWSCGSGERLLSGASHEFRCLPKGSVILTKEGTIKSLVRSHGSFAGSG